MLAAAGAGPWPAITSVCALSALWKMIGTSPPGPLRWGSTTWRVNPAATAASKALPPDSNTAMPADEASQCVEATMPWVPTSSGLVVNMQRPYDMQWQAATQCSGLTSRHMGSSWPQASVAYGQRVLMCVFGLFTSSIATGYSSLSGWCSLSLNRRVQQ